MCAKGGVCASGRAAYVAGVRTHVRHLEVSF